MSKRQNGFGVIEILLVIVAVSLIGAAGWYAYIRQDKNEKSTQSSQKQNEQANKDTQKPPEIPSDWQWFIAQDGETKFAHPKSWGNLKEKTRPDQNIYESDNYISLISITSKKELLTQVPKSFVDYTWYSWDVNTNSLVSASETAPPDSYQETYEKPKALGLWKSIDPIFSDAKGRSLYEVLGKGAMNCGTSHFFFEVGDKVIEIPASLCSRDEEWAPQNGEGFREDFITDLKKVIEYLP